MGVLEYLPAPGELEHEDQARWEAEAPPEPPATDYYDWEMIEENDG